MIGILSIPCKYIILSFCTFSTLQKVLWGFLGATNYFLNATFANGVLQSGLNKGIAGECTRSSLSVLFCRKLLILTAHGHVVGF